MEIRACDRAATGVVGEAVVAEGVVWSRRLGSARPRDGPECARVAVGSMDSELSMRPVYTSCGCPQVKPRAGQSSLCTLHTHP